MVLPSFIDPQEVERPAWNPRTGSEGPGLGPCREADSTSGHFLFLTSGLPLFQILNKIHPPQEILFMLGQAIIVLHSLLFRALLSSSKNEINTTDV